MPPQRRRSSADTAKAKPPGSPNAGKPSKRRVRSHACVPCRRRRSKCDGVYPSCSTCSKVYQIECFYDQDRDCDALKPSTKGHRSPQRIEEPSSVSVPEPVLPPIMFASINASDLETDDISPKTTSFGMELPLPQIFGPETFELDFLQHRTQYRMQHWSHIPPETTTSCNTADPSPSSPALICEIMKRITPPEIRRWFRKPYDPSFLAHLLDLYFSWIHPAYEFFPREQFLLDFQSGNANNSGRILVNAIAAYACRYSDRLAALADPQDPSTAGDQFFAEAERLLYSIAEPSAMLAQALSVMSSRELSCGRISTSLLYAERYQSMIF